ncbi:MAG: sulfate adenylyltransferase [Thermoplasmata archaeon]|nr:sulfate adenylyltransferase [Thermoplasmata archaeon]
MIPPPHGGRLVQRIARPAERDRRKAEFPSLPKLHPFIDQVFDAEKISIGAYSPLEGFMDRATFESVLATRRLPNGLPWTIPILFAPSAPEDQAVVRELRGGEDVALVDRDNRFFAVFHVTEKFAYDKANYAQKTFLTTDPAHPNVADLFAAGDSALGGSVELLDRLDLPVGRFEMTPAETRSHFEKQGWKSVAAYQCRNPPHTAHEYLQRCTLDREDVDALFIHPVVGRLKKGDYKPEVILAAYQALVDHYYPKNRILLSSLTVTMRYAGPNAALFYAIVRKNYGCGMYIVGRDQAGVGKYYDPYACHRIFDELPIDIVPLRYPETFFCRECGWMATPKTCNHPATSRVSTAQTLIREKLAKKEPLPTEILRPEVAQILQEGGEVIND